MAADRLAIEGAAGAGARFRPPLGSLPRHLHIGAGSRLPVCANVLGVIGDDGIAVVKIPERSGVDKMAIDNWVGILNKRGYIEVVVDPAGRRRRVARLTAQGSRARDIYLRWVQNLEDRWPDARWPAAVRRVRKPPSPLSGVPGPGSHSCGRAWNRTRTDGGAQVPPRQALPHFPVVTARGGGSPIRQLAHRRKRVMSVLSCDGDHSAPGG